MMDYLDARDQRTLRAIQPLHVRRVAGELILVAFCQLRNERRTFKLERIVGVSRIEHPGAAKPPELPAETPPLLFSCPDRPV